MRRFISIAMIAGAAFAQEFEVASVKSNPPQTGFHFAADAASGGPGTPDPAMFRCTKCSLATLVVKAFNLQPYQFPGRTGLADNTYDVQATVPAGATPDQFSAMLQNLLKDRFGLAWHFDEKKLKGYHLVVAKSGPKLKESGDAPPVAKGESHNHSGVMAFGTTANFRASNQTTSDLARVLSDQLGLPVDDETSLTGKYDITLRWSGNAAAHPGGGHTDAGGFGHGGHDGGGGAPGPIGDPSGPTLFDAVQQQLGLKLVAADQAVARLFFVDKVAVRPTEN